MSFNIPLTKPNIIQYIKATIYMKLRTNDEKIVGPVTISHESIENIDVPENQLKQLFQKHKIKFKRLNNSLYFSVSQLSIERHIEKFLECVNRISTKKQIKNI